MRLVKEGNLEYWLNDNGQYHGEFKWWYIDGQLYEHCFYVNDKLHGEFEKWYENGQIYAHCFYVNGQKHGEHKLWWGDGQLSSHGFYVNGDVVRDLLDNPVTDEDKFLMTLETGGKWIC